MVSIQPPGSGTEVVARRMLEAAGLDPARDLVAEHLGPAQAMDALKDGKIDAWFNSSGVPMPAVVELAATAGREMRLVPSAELLPALHARHGADAVPAGRHSRRAATPARTTTCPRWAWPPCSWWTRR